MGRLRGPGATDRVAVDEALELTGLTALRRRPVGDLSGGRRQRVLVVRAPAAGSCIRLLDKPFTESMSAPRSC
ncbi:ATP-binding cassette domain-containing protein [Streptomyces sp. NPDC050211]|uniref:ATP-binding cassette domain-containing protein n=1 Tax=Streptomyces sp. NPDC050211 TaxID=3154932 RepID=UPI003416B0AB